MSNRFKNKESIYYGLLRGRDRLFDVCTWTNVPIAELSGTNTLSGATTVSKCVCLASEKVSTLNGKNLLMGASSLLLE